MKKYAFFVALSAFLFSCTDKPQPEEDRGYQASRAALPQEVGLDSALLVADSIIYDVTVQNPEPEDEWKAFCLRKVDTRGIADWVFDEVYSGRLQAYSYADMVPLTVEQVKSFEADTANARRKIAKIQFEENWFLDTKTQQLVKKVHAIMLAYVINAQEGRYRAGIKVILPDKTPASAEKNLVKK